jgi:hypothetical protein
MNRQTFEHVARESLTEVLDELGYARDQHLKICGWLAWPEYQPQDWEPSEWCAELGDGRQDARGILRICIPIDSTEEDAKRTIKKQIHDHGIVPPPHLGYKPMHQDDSVVRPKELSERLQAWKQDLIDDVVTFYRAGNKERGRLAFGRWKERFTDFLKKNVPSEASRFEAITFHIGWVVKPGEHPLEQFMREDGTLCLAFIEDLTEAALKGQITELEIESLRSQQLTLARVFLSYAREDIEAAERLFNDLKKSGANMWFDRESLLPGQKWKTKIKQAIMDSRFFIALLSKNSVNKKGYVQKELKDALEILDEYPDSAVFLIPVRLDASRPVDPRLHDIQWVDMFPDWSKGLSRILKVLES